MASDNKPLKVELVSNATVSRLARKLAYQVQDSGFRPDMVICIARGGYVPARFLCDYMNIFELASIRIRHYTGAEKTNTAELVDPLAIDIEDMNILLVDDVNDSGETLQLALGYMENMAAKEIKTAVLHHKIISKLVPDFYAQKIIQWRWIIYPWAIVEDMLSFVKTMKPLPASPEEAKIKIEQQYGITLPGKTMEDVYRLL